MAETKVRRGMPIAIGRLNDINANLALKLFQSAELVTYRVAMTQIAPTISALSTLISFHVLCCIKPIYPQIKISLGATPLDEAVTASTVEGLHQSSNEVQSLSQKIFNEARTCGNYGAAVDALLSLVRNDPNNEELQRIVAQLFTEMGDVKRAVLAWESIVARFPNSHASFRSLASAVLRQSGFAAARALVTSRFSQRSESFEHLWEAADAWDTIGYDTAADAAFERLTTLFGDREDAWTAAVSRLEALGRYRHAADLLHRFPQSGARSSYPVKRLRQINGILNRLPIVAPKGPSRRQERSIGILKSLLKEIVLTRNELPITVDSRPKSMTMVTGSLGVGGSERQLVNTALGLVTIRSDTNVPRDRPKIDSVNVIVRSLNVYKNEQFFRPELDRIAVPVLEYRHLPIFGGAFARSALRPIVNDLKILPMTVLEGVLRLSDVFRSSRPDIVQIWQDGMVYSAGLAALIAGVPRIILSLRSVPPIDRPGRYKIEFPVIFQALMSARGVTLSVNSHYAANRYSEWLGIRKDRISVIANGVSKLPPNADAASRLLFRRFEERTEGSSVTIGVVMRLDENKRPLLWVETAARVLAQMPSARFILVGDGPLRLQVMRWVAAKGISDRFLFIGVSHDVGFWLSKMDAFMLLSKNEGLPNVLIEAQLSGIPVVTTAAGGAPETLIPEVTGVVMARNPTPDEVARIMLRLMRDPARRRAMGQAGAKWARTSFSMAKMVAKTINLINGFEEPTDDVRPDLEARILT